MSNPDKRDQADYLPHDHAVMPADISADLRRVLYDMPGGVLLMDRDWRLTYANERARQISRIGPEDLNGPTHWELFPATLGTDVEQKYRRVMDERVEEEMEFFYEPFRIWIHVRAVPVENGIGVFYQDVTELRRVREEAAAKTRQLQQVFDVTTDAVVSLNREWRYIFLNRRAKDLLGVGDEMLGEVMWNRFPEAVYPDSPFVANYYKAMMQRESTAFEAYYPHPLNKWFRLECLPSEDGIVVFFRDITQRKLDEESLRQSEERYRILAEMSPLAIWTATPQGDVNYANHTFLKYLGPEFELDTGTTRAWIEAFAPEDRERLVAAWMHSVQTGEPYSVEARMIRGADGAHRWWCVEASSVRDADGQITRWLGIAIDIHDQRVAIEALRQEKEESERQRAELEAIYQTAPVGLILFDPKELRYARINDRQAEMMGMTPEEVLGKPVEEVVSSPVVWSNLRTVAAGGVVRDYTFETEFAGRPGEKQSFNVNYSPVFDSDGKVRAVSVAALDVTQLRKAERALLQSEKLAAVGRLASSISHEINNPLEAVTNLLYLVAHDPALPKSLHSYIHSAQDELGRVSQIATQTLRFHRQANKPTLVTPAQLVDAVLNLYQGRLMNSDIHVEASYSTTAELLCFENDIRQVLNNLIANAIDAMRSGGRLVVRAHNARHAPTGTEGVRIVVADTGSGMSVETQQRLFEAFYTTKDLNGTGLGLWISKEIVDRHRGQLTLRSSQDERLHGTVFSLFLPLR